MIIYGDGQCLTPTVVLTFNNHFANPRMNHFIASNVRNYSLLCVGVCMLATSSVAQEAQPATVPAPPTVPGSAVTMSAVLGPLAWVSDAAGVSLRQADATVLRYEFSSGTKPIVYPLAGPGGIAMTRDYPMQPASAGGTNDHPHHRSLWFTHGEVNGVDFWLEDPKKGGRIVHRDVVQQTDGDDSAVLETTADWLMPDDQIVLTENRKMIVSATANPRGIEFVIDLTAGDQPVHFGDTKEGSFGLRMADSIAVDAKLGGVILNEHGQHNGDAWGQRSRWVDYSGPIGNTIAGVTILEHPDSHGHPCRWHVRTYGLFAANPFGEHHFVGGEPTAGYTLAVGQTLHLHYLLLIHDGAANVEEIEAAWQSLATH